MKRTVPQFAVYLDPVTLTDGCGGYMLMTAYLAFYDVV